MLNRAITVHLPPELFQQLSDAATNANRPLDEIVVRSIRNGMPPSVTQIPERFRDDLREFYLMDDALLWKIGEAELSQPQLSRYEALLSENQEGDLSEANRIELETLREEADLLMFQRTYAYVLLKWRGHQIPNLAV